MVLTFTSVGQTSVSTGEDRGGEGRRGEEGVGEGIWPAEQTTDRIYSLAVFSVYTILVSISDI